MTKLAIVGLGYWGPNLLRNFSQVGGCVVKYGCDLRKEVLDKLALQYPHTDFTDDYSKVLTDTEVDAVVIATPVFAHYDLAKKALEAGKHVLLEKPMAAKVYECQELIELARRKGLILMVDHTFLYTGAVRKIKELVRSGKLGKTYYFDSERINLGLIQSDVNVIWDLAPHDISIMNHIFTGMKPVSVFATGTKHVNSEVCEMAHVSVQFDSGIVGHIHVSWLSPVKIRKVLIGGDKKMILYNDLEPSEKIRVYDKGIDVNWNEVTAFKPAYRSGDVWIPKLDDNEALKYEAQHFVNCMKGKEKPLVSGEDGLDVVRILEACDKSLEEGRSISLFDTREHGSLEEKESAFEDVRSN